MIIAINLEALTDQQLIAIGNIVAESIDDPEHRVLGLDHLRIIWRDILAALERRGVPGLDSKLACPANL